MHYLERGADLRRDARRPEPGMRSAVVVAMNYGGTQPSGPIARYARGDDYHDVMKDKLDALGHWFVTASGGAARTRSYVDTGPVLERALARRAGLGWFGKNTNLINPKLGSFFSSARCLRTPSSKSTRRSKPTAAGTCTRRLDACPTDAFTAPRSLDATRCIAYLTIELKGEIPPEFRAPIGELVYGCDICQDVCPWNVRFSRDVTEPALMPRTDRINPDAAELLALNDAEWRARFRKKRDDAREASRARAQCGGRARKSPRSPETIPGTGSRDCAMIPRRSCVRTPRGRSRNLNDRPRARPELLAFKQTQPRTPRLVRRVVEARGLSFAVYHSPEIAGPPPLVVLHQRRNALLAACGILWPALAPLAATRQPDFVRPARARSDQCAARAAATRGSNTTQVTWSHLARALGIARCGMYSATHGEAASRCSQASQRSDRRSASGARECRRRDERVDSARGRIRPALARLTGVERQALAAIDPRMPARG